MTQQRMIGQDYTANDLRAKITGRARYAEDFRAEGMVFAKLLLSPMPRGRVTRLDLGAALALDGVVGALTADDVPPLSAPSEPVLTNEPVYQGQPIAAIAAVDETTAANAVELIGLEMEPLPFALDPLDSLRPGGPNALPEGNVYRTGREIETLKWSDEAVDQAQAGILPEGVEATVEWTIGDLEAGFAEAALILEEPIVFQSQTHHPLEPRSALAYWRNGRLFLHCSTQSVGQTRSAHAQAMELDEEDLVLISEFCGGGFGSKIRGTVTDLIPAHFSRKLARPVMMRVTRAEETFFGRARPGLQGWARIGFRADGRITALDLFLIQDNGPFARRGDFIYGGEAASLAYQPLAMRQRSLPVLTNTPPRSDQRAPGGLQVMTMLESLMDRAARELGVDRLDLMRVNAPERDAWLGSEQSGVSSTYMRQAIDRGRELFRWDEKKRLSGQRTGSKVRGVGAGISPFYAGSSGWDGLVVIRPDGRLYVHQGIGNLGTHSVMDTARVAAEVLGMPWDGVTVVWGDTSRNLPWSSTQDGSQTTVAHGRANHAAGMDAKRKLQEIAALDLGGSPDQYEVAGGRVFRRGAPSTGMSFARAAERAIERGGRFDGHEVNEDLNEMTVRSVEQLAGQGLIGAAKDTYPNGGYIFWSTVVGFCSVEVDVETGHVDVMEYFGVADCGTVMNPRSLGAQIIGGGTQGISSALFEKWVFDPRWGVTGSLRLHEARPLGFLDAPREAGWAAVELPDPNTPVGARGIGEPGIGGGATAVVSAINDALGGHYFNRTPLSADRILAAIEGRQTGFGPLQTHV